MVNALVIVALVALISALVYSSGRGKTWRRKVRRAARRRGLIKSSK